MPPFKCKSNQQNFKAKTKTSTTDPADTSEGKEGKTKHKTADLVPKPNSRHVGSTQGVARPGILPQYQLSTQTGR